MKRNLTQEEVSKDLAYDPDTGIFTWLRPDYGRPKSKVAGCKMKNGYIVITYKGTKYQAHRLAFLLNNGYFLWEHLGIFFFL